MKTRRPRTFAPLAWLAVVAGLLLGVDIAGLRFNLTASLPLGLYREAPRPAGLGDLVAVCPPPEWVRLGRDRGYLPPGRCDGGGAPLLKWIVAVEGRVVVVDAAGVTLDGHWLQAPAPTVDRQGRPLAPLPEGHHRLGPGQLWIATSDPRSLDSRYFGPVTRDAVLATVVPVWTWASTSDPTRNTP